MIPQSSPLMSRSLAALLKDACSLVGDGFSMPDERSPFWAEAAQRLGCSPVALAELASTLESLDVTEVNSCLYLGTLDTLDCPLALDLLNITAVVRVCTGTQPR